MDGFSRRILWLTLGNTNRNPATILLSYLNYIGSINGVPRLIRCDLGTENGMMLDVHTLLRTDHNDPVSRKPYIVGKSPHNQRIEAWWGYLFTHFAGHWKGLFNDMVEVQLYEPANDLHVQLLQFCFTQLLRQEAEDVVRIWNHHKIRKSHEMGCPPGIPEVLYRTPQLYGKHDYKYDVNRRLYGQCMELAGPPVNDYGCSDEFAILCLEIMLIQGLSMPSSENEAIELFPRPPANNDDLPTLTATFHH